MSVFTSAVPSWSSIQAGPRSASSRGVHALRLTLTTVSGSFSDIRSEVGMAISGLWWW
jgi:hypothetical protein